MSRGLPLVRLDGDAHAMGLKHGRAAKARVTHNVRAYLRRFQSGGLSPDDIRERADAYRKVIEDTDPEYASVMRGIAQGSDQPLRDIVAVNVRYEILYSEFARTGMEEELAGSSVGGCTSFAVLPENVADGHLLVGQNWDWIPDVQGILVRTQRDDGLEGLAFTEAGIAGAKFGLNSAGLGLAINGLLSNRDSWSHLRKPFHVRCWEILGSPTMDEAVRAVTAADRSCSANFLIAKAGEGGPQVVDLEAAPEGETRLSPSNGFLAHTNHFTDPEGLGVWQPLAGDRSSTFHRAERVHELLNTLVERGRGITVDDLKGMLRNHDGYPISLCHHPDPARAPEERSQTLVSAIMDLDAGELFVASGTPCTARYRRLSLTS